MSIKCQHSHWLEEKNEMILSPVLQKPEEKLLEVEKNLFSHGH